MSVSLVGCPICGKSPIDINCVRDWLKVSGHPLHSEWQERMAQYANEVASLAFQRGQQAMAEKAAQLADRHAGAIGFDCGPMQLVQEIRSLDSAEPPQGEAEKEGRRRAERKSKCIG